MDEAVEMIHDIIEGRLQAIGDVSRTMRMSERRHKDLIGKGGRQIQDMSAKYGVFMEVEGSVLRME